MSVINLQKDGEKKKKSCIKKEVTITQHVSAASFPGYWGENETVALVQETYNPYLLETNPVN